MIHLPEIHTISDVLPHISGRKEFAVNEKDGYNVICYNVQTADTFSLDPNDIRGSLIRRECRGILFESKTGKIISRPFQKFFNLGEKEETQPHKIDLSSPHFIEEKIDGSLIRIFSTEPGSHLRFGTKRGETDISAAAETFARANLSRDFFEWAHTLVESGFTPLFEWTSPDNRIVLCYEEPKLTLLAIRENISGEYLSRDEILQTKPSEIDLVQRCLESHHSSVHSLAEAIRGLKGEEGIVLTFPEKGFQKIKIKSEEYCQIHSAKELICSDRRVIVSSLKGTLDDALGIIPEEERKIALDTEKAFWSELKQKAEVLENLRQEIISEYGGDENFFKRVALEWMPKKDKRTQDTMFLILKRPQLSAFDALIEKANKASIRDVTMNEFREWLEGPNV